MTTESDNRFERALARGATVLLDGGFATELEAQGHNIDGKLWSAKMLVENPQAIIDAHRAYLDAGAECIISASYQASRKTMADVGIDAEEADRLIAKSVELANEARQQFLAANPSIGYEPMVAASIGPYGASQNDGSEYTGVYDADEVSLIEFHQSKIGVLDDSGADVLAIETIPNATEAQVLAELLHDCNTPAWVSFCCRDGQHLSDGTALSLVAKLYAELRNVPAIGINCTSPEFVTSLIGELKSVSPDKAIIVYPNSGETYASKTNTWHGTVSPVECADASVEWRNAGATIIGGCCRMGPQHIAAMREQLGRT